MARHAAASSKSPGGERRRLRIDIIADFVCPWCYIGIRRLERALAMRPAIMPVRSWLPFQLNPDLPPEGIPYDVYIRLKFGGRHAASQLHAALARAGERERIDFAIARIRRIPNTLAAHRLIRFAAAAGAADAVAAALFRGYFSEGRDIGDLDTLAAIGAEAGLDAAPLRAGLLGDSELSQVLLEEYRARRAGIDAVPCFIMADEYALAGAQEPEAFLPLFDLAAVPHDRRQYR